MWGPVAPAWYGTCRFLAGMGLQFGFSFRTEGRRNIPLRGPAIVIANHASYLDPVIVGLATPRHLCFLARKSLFKNPFFGWLISSVNALPIDQEGIGKQGLTAIMGKIQQGEAVLVFPEGTRSPDGNMTAFKPGVHLLIRRTRVPIVPVGIAGAYEAWPLHRPLPSLSPVFLPPTDSSITAVVGEPVDGAKYAEMPREEALAELAGTVQALKDRAEGMRRR